MCRKGQGTRARWQGESKVSGRNLRFAPNHSVCRISSWLKEVERMISWSSVMGLGMLQVMGTKPFVQVA